ncbi:hypothetical protein PY093_18765 [Cytobacillus sp. S13-E01]|uniref:hypothetical protein n=1 Tax=Cytobacillus sp. S13-E01 TaxID=3031326 RepID=UPI0023D8A646|nr:hypothetical protein [Cytobacillus sp. S13-E01]MDF0728671.1 hypothetical protein [Cytobacillus sp. S13-E01]
MHNPIAYYYGILTKKLDELFYQELSDLEETSENVIDVSQDHPNHSNLALMRELLF